MANQTAVVVGVGPGLGWAVSKKLAESGFKVFAAARKKENVEALVSKDLAERVVPVACDATDAASVKDLFAKAKDVDVAVFNAGAFGMKSFLDLEAADLENMWRVNCLAGFQVGQAAARAMVARGKGTIIFTGATAALRGAANFAAFASSKFGLRAIAQSMARELGPKNIHVAHVVIDGIIDGGRTASYVAGKGEAAGLSTDAIAETYLHIANQHRSAWTHEIDLRPFAERF